MQERRENGLCYYCDDMYQPGQSCNRPKLYLLGGLEVEGREEVMEDEDVLEVHVEDLECALAEGELLGNPYML
jgi:hypothetical protein